MSRAFVFALLLPALTASCKEAPQPEPAAACTDDTQCKGTRTCEDGVCVEPPPHEASTAGAGGAGGTSGVGTGGAGGTGQAFLPAQCLVDVKCVYDSDCPNGHHCNDAIPIPQCEELYCGPAGSVCSENELCLPGLVCTDARCQKPDPCSCEALCSELDACGFGFDPQQCLDSCAAQPEPDACWCAALASGSFCSTIVSCAPPGG